MKILITFIFFLLLQPTYAAINPKDLVKVTPENNPQCVEYYTYQNAMYCSTKPLLSEPVDPAVKNYETQKIQFDDRPWQAAWGEKNKENVTVEYVPMGDNINHWHELITSQFFSGLQKQVTPKEFADIFLEGIKKAGFDPIVTYHKETPDKVIFEFTILKPENQIQNEIQMVTKGENGLYVLHYVMKKSDMGEKNRKRWLENFSASKIK